MPCNGSSNGSSNGLSNGLSNGSSEDHPGEEVAITCDALCSLGNSSSRQQPKCTDDPDNCAKFTAKQFQLPMFLTKTYHMIGQCGSDVADWSDAGDSFVIKNVDKFANSVLPLYFKHSNFSSFARQLNFYGFRKLRPDTILTTDLDPATANHVRFHHSHFQRDKPDLLQHIKRATTKGGEQAKDDVDTLRQEVSRLREELMNRTTDFNQKIAELSYDCNRRISAMTTEYEKLASLVHNSIKTPAPVPSHHFFTTTGTPGQIVVLPNPCHSQPMHMHLANAGDLFQSLSQAATATLQQEGDRKRAADEDTNDRNGKHPESISSSRL